MKILTALAFYLFYRLCRFLGTGSDRRDLAGLRSYPDAVQRAVREHPVPGKAAPRERALLSILPGNLLLLTAVFSALGLALKGLLGLHGFGAAFWFFLALGEGLGGFVLVVIDLLWWRSTRRVRFTFLPEKAPYQDPCKHIGSFLRGIPLFAAVAAQAAGIVTMLG